MIDFHTHIFPENLSARAVNYLATSSGNMLVYSTGDKDDLIKMMDLNNVDISVILNIATNEHQMKNVNDFAISVNGYMDRLISFGSVYPNSDSAVPELYRLKENGIKGIKFHPEYQDFYVDDDKLANVYETITKLGLITVFHAGMDNGFYNTGRASAYRFVNTLKALHSPVVLAHMGGYMQWLQVEEHLAGLDVYFDTSFCFSRIPLPIMAQLVKKHGDDKILFASDSPWSTAQLELRLINALDISEDSKENILHNNAKMLLEL